MILHQNSDRSKKILFCCLCVFSLFLLNLNVFSVRASANSVSGSYDYYICGCPVNFEYYDSSELIEYDVLLSDVTSYFYSDEDGTPSWRFSDVNDSNVSVDFDYRLPSSVFADVFLAFPNDILPNRFYSNGNYFIQSSSDLDFYNVFFGMDNVDNVTAHYSYTFNAVRLGADGSPVIYSDIIFSTRYFSENSSGYVVVPLFDTSILNSTLVNSYLDFSGSGLKWMWITSASCRFSNVGVSSNLYYFDAPTDHSYTDFYGDQDAVLRSIFNSDEVIVDFDDVSWTDWLVNAVGGFMDFEIVPNLSISGILALLVGMSLFMVFLKVFAGG